MKIHKTNSHIDIVFEQDLNLFTARRLIKLAKDVKSIHIDLKNARIIGSEGLIALYRLHNDGKELMIANPPSILFEIVKILNLDEVLPLKKMISSDQY
jgi:anti-anti-sigma regulatory factor